MPIKEEQMKKRGDNATAYRRKVAIRADVSVSTANKVFKCTVVNAWKFKELQITNYRTYVLTNIQQESVIDPTRSFLNHCELCTWKFSM